MSLVRIPRLWEKRYYYHSWRTLRENRDLDEIDALAISRNSEMHEASRRVLSTLLRNIDSFESNNDILVICATNRKDDLDKAMLSRID